MTVQPHEITPAIIGPIAPAILDGVTFASVGPEAETAYIGTREIGHLYHDDLHDCWRAIYGTWEATRARCRAEARAYIVRQMRARL